MADKIKLALAVAAAWSRAWRGFYYLGEQRR